MTAAKPPAAATTAELVAELAREVGTIDKDERGQFGSFRSVGRVMSEVGTQMARLGLSLSSSVVVHDASATFLAATYSFAWESRFGQLPAGSMLVAGCPPKPGMTMTTTGAMASYAWRLAVQGSLAIPTEDVAASDPEHTHHEALPVAVASAPRSRGELAAGPERPLPADNSERVREVLVAAAGGDVAAAGKVWERQAFGAAANRTGGNVRAACELLSAAAKPAAEGEEPF